MEQRQTIKITPDDANLLYNGFDTSDYIVIIYEAKHHTFNVLVEDKNGHRYTQTNHCRVDLMDDPDCPPELIDFPSEELVPA